MIETYAFLAALTVQILLLSLLQPAWATRYARAKAEAQLPGLDRRGRDRFLILYRAVNAGIALLGLGLLGWLFQYMRNPAWDAQSVMRLQSVYTVLQVAPYMLLSLVAVWIKKKTLLHSPPEAIRTASLERRGLFDIVSPGIIIIAALAYVLFVACVFYVRLHPFPGFTGYASLSLATLAYGASGASVYWLLYGRKRWPRETRAYRAQAVETQVRVNIYSCIAVIAFLAMRLMLNMLQQPRWMPFAVSAYIVTVMLLTSTMMFALRRQAEADQLSPKPAL